MIAQGLLLGMLLTQPDPRAWTATDSTLESALVLVTAVDWAQTRTALAAGRYERNPVLGRHPSELRLGLTVGGALAAHAAIAYILPKPWRTLWQCAWVAVEVTAVGVNHSAGVRIDW